jgi:type IV pilus assembly protein PilQ
MELKMARNIFFLLVSISVIISLHICIIAQPDDTTQIKQTMSLDVKDTEISDVIRMISRGYGLNIILDRDVTGKVTLHLTDAPIIEGLNTLAESNGWELVKEGSVYRIRKPVAKTKSSIKFSKGRLTVDIQNVNVIDFIKEISSKTAVSIVPDSKISGMVSGKLYKVPLEDGLKALLEGNGFKVTKRRNIYRVSQEIASTSTAASDRRKSRRSTKGRSKEFFVECEDGFLNIDVINGDLSTVINAISEQSDIEIIIYGKLSGEVNAKLNNIPLAQGLALLLGGTKFTFVLKDNVILIGDRNTATPSGKTLSKSELIHLKHIKADEVPKILPKNIPVNNVKVIKEQNALLVSGTSEDIVKTGEFLETIDIPTPQVVIDVVVVEYTRDLDRDFGFEFAANKKNQEGKVDAGSNEWSFPELQVNRSGSKAKEALGLIFGEAAFISSLPESFHMALRMLETQKKAKVLAQPSITVLNGNKATIDVGQTQYYRVTGGTPQNPTHNFRPIKFGISLNITPWISKSGQITAEISPEISNSMGITEGDDGGYPNLFRRSATTTVRIDDGKTLILGGLLRSEEQVTHKKVPFLGDIPILGYLFKTTKKLRVQTNLVIYITPRIVDKDNYVDLNEELKQFDINERKGVFKRRKFIEKERPLENIREDNKGDEITNSPDENVETKQEIKKADSKHKKREKENNTKESDKKKTTSIRKPRKRVQKKSERTLIPPDTTEEIE